MLVLSLKYVSFLNGKGYDSSFSSTCVLNSFQSTKNRAILKLSTSFDPPNPNIQLLWPQAHVVTPD